MKPLAVSSAHSYNHNEWRVSLIHVQLKLYETFYSKSNQINFMFLCGGIIWQLSEICTCIFDKHFFNPGANKIVSLRPGANKKHFKEPSNIFYLQHTGLDSTACKTCTNQNSTLSQHWCLSPRVISNTSSFPTNNEINCSC